MRSHGMKNPTGGVSMGHVIEPPNPNSFIIRLRPDKLCETPGTDPQAVVLWGGERETPLPDSANIYYVHHGIYLRVVYVC
jgi:hypothetical protein